MKQSIKVFLLGLIPMFFYACSSSETTRSDSTVSKDTAKEEKELSLDTVAEGNPYENSEFKMGNRGIMIVGEGSQKRAFSVFGGREQVTKPYIDLANDMKKEFPGTNLYAMVIPGAAAYYVPEKAKQRSKPMEPAFEYLQKNLDPSIKYVDVFKALGAHTKEYIFSRTDHHWAPRGGYYAARALAAAAGVPFKDLSDYDEHVVHGYIGSMPNYSGDSSLRNYPEDFYYYTPKGVNVKTTFTAFNKDKETGVVTEGKTRQGEFFHHYPDGAGGAYCTFMGGDQNLVKVETGVPNSRRILIIKDSHGNTIPGYLFNSFEEIHVIDYRYFTRNLKKYVADNKITDIALTFGINTSGSSGNMKKVRDFLTQ